MIVEGEGLKNRYGQWILIIKRFQAPKKLKFSVLAVKADQGEFHMGILRKVFFHYD